MLKVIEKIKDLFSKTKSVNSYLKYPDGKRIYREFHTLRIEDMDKEGLKIINRLVRNKYKAYFVGGCIRDLLLNRSPKDFDVVTNATPKEIKKLFANSKIIGKRFKIVHVYFKNKKKGSNIKIVEVSTFRKIPEHRLNGDAKNIDHTALKRDNFYVGNPKEDAARRDFTINSIYFDPLKEVIIDYTGGVEDIQKRLIRVIGDPDISYKEDPVRMIRAAKFASLLNFQVEKKSLKAIERNKWEILKINKNRLHEEFMKIFRTGVSASIIESLYNYGLFDVLFPEVFEKSIKNLQKDHKNKKLTFKDSLIFKRLQIADKLLAEREDLTFNIYMALIFADLVYKVFFVSEVQSLKIPIDQYIKDNLTSIFQNLLLPGKDVERIFQIYIAQRQIGNVKSNQTKVVQNRQQEFKQKKYFFESFMVYKIYSLALNDEEMIQKAMVWEIGERKTPPEDAKIISLYYKPPKTIL